MMTALFLPKKSEVNRKTGKLRFKSILLTICYQILLLAMFSKREEQCGLGFYKTPSCILWHDTLKKSFEGVNPLNESKWAAW